MRVFRRLRIRVVVMQPRAEVACIAVFTAIRGYAQNVVEQEFPKAVPLGPVE